jgi:hypothetical protein
MPTCASGCAKRAGASTSSRWRASCHVEGATAGSDPAQGIKRFQAVNRAKFAERWKDRLRAAPEPVPFGTARFVLPGQRRILIVDHVVPATDEDAGSVILVETILLLQRLGYLVVLGAQRTPDRRDRKVLALERLGVEVIRAPYYRSVLEYISVHEGQLDLVFMVRHAIAEQILAGSSTGSRGRRRSCSIPTCTICARRAKPRSTPMRAWRSAPRATGRTSLP